MSSKETGTNSDQLAEDKHIWNIEGMIWHSRDGTTILQELRKSGGKCPRKEGMRCWGLGPAQRRSEVVWQKLDRRGTDLIVDSRRRGEVS